MTIENSYELTDEEQELFDRRSARLSKYMTLAVDAKSEMQNATTKAFDAGAEFGFELGAVAKEEAVLALIDEMFSKLTDEEEDAKLTLEIIKQMILRLDNENEQ